MSSGPAVRLGDVASFIRGITFKPDDVVPVETDGSVACLRTKNVQSELDVSDVWGIPASLVKRKDQYLAPGDLLVSSANSWNLVGKCSWVPDLPWKATFGGFVSVLRGDPKKVDQRYLYHWFSSPRVQATVRSFGQQTTNISNLNADRCLQLPLPLPPVSEQRRVTAILDKVGALRAKRRAALTKLDTLTQSIFLDMFGDPATNPKGWPLAPLRACTQRIQIGPFGSQLHQEDYIEGGIPLVNPKHIQGGGLTLGTSESVRPEKFAQLAIYHLRPGDVVMGRRGEMGRCAIVQQSHGRLLCGTGSLFLRPDLTKTTSVYLFAALSSPVSKEKFQRLSLGQTLPNLNSKIVEFFEIPVPPVSLQNDYAKTIDKAESLQSKQKTSLRENDLLFAALQHRAFRGEL